MATVDQLAALIKRRHSLLDLTWGYLIGNQTTATSKNINRFSPIGKSRDHF
jgi:hypothetical protein